MAGCSPECFEASLEICSGPILLKAGLQANHSYYWLLTDRHGNITQRRVDTDADGTLTMDADALPTGLNLFSGSLQLEVREGDDYLQKVALTFDDVEYLCVQISFIEIDRDDNDESETNVIQSKQPA